MYKNNLEMRMEIWDNFNRKYCDFFITEAFVGGKIFCQHDRKDVKIKNLMHQVVLQQKLLVFVQVKYQQKQVRNHQIYQLYHNQ